MGVNLYYYDTREISKETHPTEIRKKRIVRKRNLFVKTSKTVGEKMGKKKG